MKNYACKRSVINFDVKAMADGAVKICGYANKATVDDAKDYIEPYSWDLSRFQKNPVVFFNHNPDYPIGRCDVIEQKDDGLYCEIMISASPHEKVSYVRDMINEGILKTFSVGFETKKAAREKDLEGSEYNVITGAKLHEISVVSLPMNEDSTFSQKSKIALWSKKMAKWDSYKRAKKDVLQAKGAWVASELQEAIYEAQESGQDKKGLYEKIMQKAGIDQEAWKSILAGEVTPVPESVLEACALILGISFPELQKINEEDVALEPANAGGEYTVPTETPKPEPAPEQEGKSKEEEMKKPECKDGLAPKDTMSEEELKGLQKNRSEDYGIEVLDSASLTFPKGYPDNLEDYADPVNLKYPIESKEHANDAHAKFKQSADEYKKDESKSAIYNRIVARQIAQGSKPGFDPKDKLDALLSQTLKDQLLELPKEEAKEMSPMEKCVQEKIPKLIAEGKPQDQAVAIAMSMCKEKGACTSDDIKKFIMFADSVKAAGEAPAAAVAINGPTPAADMADSSNPHLDLMKQQIVLLGVIANKLEEMSKKLDGLPQSLMPPKDEPAQTGQQQPQEVPAEKSGNLDLLKKTFDNIDKSIRDLGF